MSAVAQCDILNMSDILSDYFISDERASKFASYVNSFIWGHYQTLRMPCNTSAFASIGLNLQI